ncbi:MAG: carbohydrate kinase family protein [Lachnospiraceae bacterium]|nr:carbohydrate kinase family protein [Lachnospiraceae bacterium]
MTKDSKKIISAGHICLDITPIFPDNRSYNDIASILIPGKLINMDKADVSTGGSVANTGLALKKLGCDVTLLGKVGNDHFGDLIKSIVSSYGAGGLISDDNSSTSYSVVLAVPGIDRVFLHNPGANDTFSSDDISDEVLSDAVLFHFGYPTLMKNMYENDAKDLVRLFEKVKSKGIATSMDMAAIDPGSDAAKADWKKILDDTLAYVDFFLPSFEELCFMLDRGKYEKMIASGSDITDIIDMNKDVSPLAKKCIDMGCKTVVIKCGMRGLFYMTGDRKAIKDIGQRLKINHDDWADRSGIQPCFKAKIVRSATGAGDTSIAAFLAALINGRSIGECVRLAAAEGACCVTGYDALSGLKTLDELEQAINDGWETWEK